MKRTRTQGVQEIEDLAEKVVDVAKEFDSEGRRVYSQIYTNPAFSILLSTDLMLEILKERPLALINLIRSHPSMYTFWNRFPKLWPLLLEQIITKMYSPERWLRYPLLAYALNKTWEDWPFLSIGHDFKAYFDKNASLIRGEKKFDWHNNDLFPSYSSEKPFYFAHHNLVARLFAKLYMLVSHIHSLFQNNAYFSDLPYREMHATRIMLKLIDWWGIEVEYGAEHEDQWYIFSSCCFVQSKYSIESWTHGSNKALLELVRLTAKEYANYTIGPVLPANELTRECVEIFVVREKNLEGEEDEESNEEGEAVLLVHVPTDSQFATLFSLLKHHLEVMEDYLVDNLIELEEDDTHDMIFYEIDKEENEIYRELVFGYAGPYGSVVSQQKLVMNELYALMPDYDEEEIKTMLGSHYKTSLIQCGACGSKNVEKADENLSIAFCNESCLNKYYSEHKIVLSSLPFCNHK